MTGFNDHQIVIVESPAILEIVIHTPHIISVVYPRHDFNPKPFMASLRTLDSYLDKISNLRAGPLDFARYQKGLGMGAMALDAINPNGGWHGLLNFQHAANIA